MTSETDWFIVNQMIERSKMNSIISGCGEDKSITNVSFWEDNQGYLESGDQVKDLISA